MALNTWHRVVLSRTDRRGSMTIDDGDEVVGDAKVRRIERNIICLIVFKVGKRNTHYNLSPTFDIDEMHLNAKQ